MEINMKIMIGITVLTFVSSLRHWEDLDENYSLAPESCSCGVLLIFLKVSMVN